MYDIVILFKSDVIALTHEILSVFINSKMLIVDINILLFNQIFALKKLL